MAKKPKIPQVDIVEACSHPKLLDIPLSLGQRVFLKALDGLEMTQEELDLFCETSGRPSYVPGYYFRSGVLVAGRRFGKTLHIAVPVACYAAAFREYENLRPGERPTIVCLGPTKDQSEICFRGIHGALRNSKLLRSLIESEKADKISLTNDVDIAVWKCDFRTVRGLAIPLCVAEEASFWRSQEDPTVNPAEEILGAVRPALLQFKHGRLLLVSSPWAKSGPVWSAFAQRLEQNEPLVMRMSTAQGNPLLTPERLEAERIRDPERYEREINAAFLDAATALLPGPALDACIAKNRWELSPKNEVSYIAGIDAGFRSDAFGFSLCHCEGERVIVDLARSWKPRQGKAVQFKPVMEEIIETMRRFGATRAYADQVANEVIRQYLAEAGIELEQVSTLGRRASGIYSTLRAKVLASEIEFPDNPELIGQLKRLEIIVGSGGSERCEASSGKDDMAIASALAIHQAVAQGAPREPMFEVIQIPRGGGTGVWEEDKWFRPERRPSFVR